MIENQHQVINSIIMLCLFKSTSSDKQHYHVMFVYLVLILQLSTYFVRT